jgi:hypothetical protein
MDPILGWQAFPAKGFEGRIMNPVLLVLLASLGGMTATGASAEIYKCVENGKLSLSDMPCPSGAVSTVLPTESRQGDAPAESPAEELERLKQKLEVMQRERREREAAEIARDQAIREEAAREEAVGKAEAEKIEAQNEMARRRAALKKKKKRLEEEQRERMRRLH